MMHKKTSLLLSVMMLVTSSGGTAFAQTPPADSSKTEASKAVAAAAPAGQAVDSSYLLGFGDVVEVSLVGRADFGSRARVSTDGTILLPLIGRIQASERTVIELSDDVRQALIKGGFYADPIVRAEVVSISSRYVTVLGNVGTPGLLPLDRNYRLSEILARVGGPSGDATDYIMLTKAGASEPQRYSIARLASGGTAEDPMVQSGDKIFIPSSLTELFYISGEVKSPGGYPTSERMTMRMALAKGGGVSENGSEKKLKVIRAGKPVKGVKLEDPVQVGDIITVGERLF